MNMTCSCGERFWLWINTRLVCVCGTAHVFDGRMVTSLGFGAKIPRAPKVFA